MRYWIRNEKRSQRNQHVVNFQHGISETSSGTMYGTGLLRVAGYSATKSTSATIRTFTRELRAQAACPLRSGSQRMRIQCASMGTDSGTVALHSAARQL